MNNSVTSATYLRNIGYSLRRQLSDFLDPQERWREVCVSIRKPSGEMRYTQLHLRRFEGVVAQRKSPTMELLNDWGTTNSTVGDLVDILRSLKLFAAASLLLPDTVGVVGSEETQILPSAATHCEFPTTPLDMKATQLMSPVIPVQPLQTSPKLRSQDKQGFYSSTYEELMEITGNFDDRPVSGGGGRLGEGGFGTVYKGLINEKPVAVKKLTPMEDISVDELQIQFQQEIQTLKVLKHENLVDLIGFSCDGQHPCLVYAFMANGSLLDRLACLDNSLPLTWRQRCSIAEGTARGLEYLHRNHHVHRDVKSANILLDETLMAKISDFGLTRASTKGTSTTMMTERIVGTCAYMAPEALRGKITPKSDIFSFGVVLLEILSGLPPANENREPQFLMEFRYDIDDESEDLTLEEFIDKKMSDSELRQVETIYSLACNCLNDRKDRRPVIQQVLSEIEGVVESISTTFHT
ncbi:interleukin-1 receptor-associated kinase 4 [Cynoglossus semilaevis]|uniref:Interleukin-1 receptor-associated kinase 4 n=1 Tax=Cynoglossus semilaevis TaxID=244447 RepID=D7F473_CYNSE|nr:interleukin-1 receptor-associated kinase 4 [Cynoglossus semilaevis]ACU80549.1 IRAK4 [Cynoglossus semilaevis]